MGPSGRPTPETMLRHRDWVRRLSRELLRDAHDAADLEQETWRTAFAQPPRHTSNLKGWLGRVARNLARRAVRDERVRREHERQSAPLPSARGDAIGDVTERAELERCVLDALLELEERYRTPLLLRYFDDLSARDVAERLGVPVESARTRLKRGLALLQAKLDRHFTERGRSASIALLPLLRTRSGAVVRAGPSIAAVSSAAILLGGLWMSKLGKGIAVVLVAAGLVVTYRQIADPAKTAVKPQSAPEQPHPEPSAPATADAAVAEEVSVEPSRSAVLAPPPAKDEVQALPWVEGRVVDANGRTVGGATVLLGSAADRWFGNEFTFRQTFRGSLREETPEGLRRTTSAADGSFRFEDVSAEDPFVLGAIHDPLGTGWTAEVHLSSDAAPHPATVRLEAGVVIFGTVSDSAGRPIEGATVTLLGSTDPPRIEAKGFQPDSLMDHSLTTADGRYRSMPFPWKFAKLHVAVIDRPHFAQHDGEWEELPAGTQEIRRDLTLDERQILRGRILGLDGQLADLSHTLVPLLGEDARRVQTAETVCVAAFDTDPRVDPSVLQRLGRNEPNLVFLDADHQYGSLSLSEDRYEVPRNHAGLRFVGVIVRGRLIGAAEVRDPLADTDVEVDLELVPERPLLHTLRLHFVDGRDGTPLPGVNVYGIAKSRTPDGRSQMSMLHFGVPKELPPDRDLDLPRCPCSVQMEKAGFATRSLEVDPSLEGAPSELTIEMTPVAGSLRCHVQDEQGEPLPGVSIRLYRVEDREPVLARELSDPTNAQGLLELSGLPAGSLWVVASRQDRAPAAGKVPLGGQETPATITLTLPRGFEIELDVHPSRADSASSGLVEIRDKSGAPLYDGFHPHAGPIGLVGKRLRLVGGEHHLRCVVPGEWQGERSFFAAPDTVVELELLPIDR